MRRTTILVLELKEVPPVYLVVISYEKKEKNMRKRKE